MKQAYYRIIGLLTIIVIILISSCVKQVPQKKTINAILNNSFQLKINQIAFIESENLKIKFLNVTEDSRCPSDVLCFWAGQATVALNILQNGKNLGDFNLTIRAGQYDDLAVKNFAKYSIKLTKIDPYPEHPQEIEISNYIVKLIVSKLS